MRSGGTIDGPASSTGLVGANLLLALLAGAVAPVLFVVTASPDNRVPRLAGLAALWSAAAAASWLLLHRRDPDSTPVLLALAWAVVAVGLLGASLKGSGHLAGLSLLVPLGVTAAGVGLGVWVVLPRRPAAAVGLAVTGLVAIGGAHGAYAAERYLPGATSPLDVMLLVGLVVTGGMLGLCAAALRTWHLVGLDVTTAERHRDAARHELAQVQRTQAELLHETRNVLLAVDGASRALHGDGATVPEEHRRELGRALRAEIGLLRHLTQAGRRTDVQEVGTTCVREVVERQVRLAVERGLAVALHVEDHPAAELCPEQFEEVVLNLLLNAEHHGGGEQVEVAARHDPRSQQVVVTVTDRGPGPTAAAIPGEGLGLHICRRLTSAVGGRLTLQSRPGGGALVTVELPAPPFGAEAPAAYEPDASRTNRSSAWTSASRPCACPSGA